MSEAAPAYGTRNEHRPRLGGSVKVIAKCPTCGKLHVVRMRAMPPDMPRLYCARHIVNRHADEGGVDV